MELHRVDLITYHEVDEMIVQQNNHQKTFIDKDAAKLYKEILTIMYPKDVFEIKSYEAETYDDIQIYYEQKFPKVLKKAQANIKNKLKREE